MDGAGAVLHPAALSAVAGSARRLLALAGASPGADVGVLSRAMEELERLAAGGTAVDLGASTSNSTTAEMDIDSAAGGDAVSSNQLGGGAGAASGRRNPGTKRKREARRTGGGGDDAPGMSQRPAKRRILAWRVRRWYRSVVAKAKETARRARSRRARARAQPLRRKRAGGWKSVEQQLARATPSDGLHRWSPGGAAGGGPAGQ